MKVKLTTIKNLVMQRLTFENEFKLAAANLQSKYEEIYKPLYESRTKTVNGETDAKFNENSKNWEVTNNTTGKGIEDFWLTCILNNSSFKTLVNDNDKKVLKKLVNVKVENQNGFVSIIY